MQRKKKVKEPEKLTLAESRQYITYPRKEDFEGLIDQFIDQVLILPSDSYATVEDLTLTLPAHSFQHGELIPIASVDKDNTGNILIWWGKGNTVAQIARIPFKITGCLLLTPKGGILNGFDIELDRSRQYLSKETPKQKAARINKINESDFEEKLSVYASKESEPLPTLKHLKEIKYKSLKYVETPGGNFPDQKDIKWQTLQVPEGSFEKLGSNQKNTTTKTTQSDVKDEKKSLATMLHPRKEDFLNLVKSFFEDVIKMPQDNRVEIQNGKLADTDEPFKGEICVFQDDKSKTEPQVVIPFVIKKKEDQSYTVKFDTTVKGSTKESKENQTARTEKMKNSLKKFQEKNKLILNSGVTEKPEPQIKDGCYNLLTIDKRVTTQQDPKPAEDAAPENQSKAGMKLGS